MRAAKRVGLLIGHGSPDPRHAVTLRQLTAQVAETVNASAPDAATEIAFLEHDEPSLTDWLTSRASGTAPVEVRALGLLLASGYHAQVDIPRALDAASDRPGRSLT